MKSEGRAILLITLLLAFGVTLGLASQAIRRAYQPKSLDLIGQRPFQLIYLLHGAPHLSSLNSDIPDQASFYLAPESLPHVEKELSTDEVTVSLRSTQHSRKRREQLLTLEVSAHGELQKFYYRASPHDLTPLGWSQLDGQAAREALWGGFLRSTPLLALGCLLFFVSGKRRAQSKSQSETSAV